MKFLIAWLAVVLCLPLVGHEPPVAGEYVSFQQPAPQPTPPAPAPAPFLSLPKSVIAKVGERLEVKVAGGAKGVTWDDFPPGLTVDVLDGGLRLLVWADAGKYPLRANAYDETAKKIWHAETLIDLSRPIPPAPPPPPPAPDAFKAALAALIAADTTTTANKVSALKTLAGLYRQAATFANEPGLTTTGQLVAAIQKAGDTLLVTPSTLRPTRDRVHLELQNAGLPATDVPLTDDLRKKAADIYGRAAAALEDAAK